jgi:ribokinase
MNAGGKGANQAVAAARLGGNVTLVAKVGDDIFGQQTIEGLKKEHIKTDYVFVDEETPSGTALIIVNERRGELYCVASRGKCAAFCPVKLSRSIVFQTRKLF